jgi:tetratricopeptide (TPR) repeat protein
MRRATLDLFPAVDQSSDMPSKFSFLPLHRGGSSPCRALAAALVVMLLACGNAAAESADDAAGDVADAPSRTDGVAPELKVAVGEYIADPLAGGPRLLTLIRGADIAELPPEVQVVAADAYLRAGNRRAAERLFEKVVEADAGYPWQDFGNVGMGTVRMMSGDTEAAEQYFGQLEGAGEASSRVLGNLGMGSALAASGRFEEAQAAFDKASAANTVEGQFRQAGQFGSAMSRYGAGDYEGAAKAFEELAASDPDGPMGQSARYAAARARLALGQYEEGAEELRALAAACGDERRTRRPSRALRNLDPRAISRSWVKSYRESSWQQLSTKDGSMYALDGCALARATLPAAERNDPRLMGATVQRVSVGAAEPAAGPDRTEPRAPRSAQGAPSETSGSGWLPAAVAVLAAAALALLWFRRARA